MSAVIQARERAPERFHRKDTWSAGGLASGDSRAYTGPMHTVAELSLFPLDKGASVSPYVARAVAIIRDSGLAFELGPMGTCIEGPLAEVMAVVQACAEDLSRDCDRIYLTVKADLSRKGPGRLAAKVRSVEEKLAPAR